MKRKSVTPCERPRLSLEKGDAGERRNRRNKMVVVVVAVGGVQVIVKEDKDVGDEEVEEEE